MSADIEKVDLKTPDIAEINRANLRALFPSVLADGVLDAAALSALLDVPIAGASEGRERYGLQWAGKQEAIRSLLEPGQGTLVPDLAASMGFDKARNVFPLCQPFVRHPIR